MENIKIPVCPYCGQVKGEAEVGECVSDADYEAAAVRVCNCVGALKERGRLERVERAKGRVNEIFGAGAGASGFDPLAAGLVARLMEDVELVSLGVIAAASYKLPGAVSAAVSESGDGIRIARKDLNAKVAVE